MSLSSYNTSLCRIETIGFRDNQTFWVITYIELRGKYHVLLNSSVPRLSSCQSTKICKYSFPLIPNCCIFVLFTLVYYCILYYCFIMCLHLMISNDKLNRPIETTKYQHELDNCDYFELTDPIDASHGDLLVMQLNIRGLLGKLSNLKDLINKVSHGKRIDIILLCETWQNKNSQTPSLSGYNYIYKSRKHKMGGGVGIFINECIRFTEVTLNANYENIEYVVINITTKNENKTIMLGSLYRPLNTNDSKFVDEYNNLLSKLYKESKSKRLILGMDHNLDFLKHSTHKRTQDFIELNLDNNLIPSITRPTRITKSSATLIDNIMVSQGLSINSESRIIIDDISDHLPSVVKFSDLLQRMKTSKIITSRNLTDKTLQKINKNLMRTNWPMVITENVNDSFDTFHDLLLKTIDIHAPIVTRKLSNKSFRREPWLSASLLRSINTQKKLYTRTLKSNASECDITKYKTYKKILDKLKRSEKISYYHSKCSDFKNNVKKLWELINQVIGKTVDKSSVISHITVNETEILNEKAIANEFSKYFSSVGKTFASKVKNSKCKITYYNDKITRNPKSIYLYCTSEIEIKKLIENLPNKTSSGYDNISNILLKRLCAAILTPLTVIFNLSISNGIFSKQNEIS